MSTPPLLTDPVPRPLGRLLRAAVLEHGRSESRRVYPPILYAGRPGDPRAQTRLVAPPERLDEALRCDVVAALARTHLAAGRVPLLWLARPDTANGDDVAWACAVRAVGAELGARLHLVAVTRRSWVDPLSGVGRVWSRPIRPR